MVERGFRMGGCGSLGISCGKRRIQDYYLLKNTRKRKITLPLLPSREEHFSSGLGEGGGVFFSKQ